MSLWCVGACLPNTSVTICIRKDNGDLRKGGHHLITHLEQLSGPLPGFGAVTKALLPIMILPDYNNAENIHD